MSEVNIPEHWVHTTLGEIGTTMIGLTYSPSDISNEGTPVLRSGNVQNGKIQLNDLVRVKKEIKSHLIVKDGDIVICARNGSKALVGKAAQVKSISEPMTFGAFMAIFRSELNNYVEIFLNSSLFRNQLEGVGTATINQITQNNLKQFTIPFPPKGEQERIVQKIGSCFQKIEETQKNFNEIENKISTLSLSFLMNYGEWMEPVKLGQITTERVEKIGIKTPNLRKLGVDNKLGVVDLRITGLNTFEKYKIVRKGDILYNPMRANVGSIAIYLDDEQAITSPDYVVFSVNEGASKWLVFNFLKSLLGLQEISKKLKGSVRERLYYEKLADIEFPCPPQESSLKADKLLDMLNISILQKRHSFEKLISDIKESLLTKAFEGELVPRLEEEGSGQEFLERILDKQKQLLTESKDKNSLAKISKTTTKKKVKK